VISHVFPLERLTEGFRQADWLQQSGEATRVSRAAISMDAGATRLGKEDRTPEPTEGWR